MEGEFVLETTKFGMLKYFTVEQADEFLEPEDVTLKRIRNSK